MKIYEIIDSENNLSVGVLLYYEKKKDFIIELQEYLDEWTAPLLFTNLVKRGIYTVPRDLSFTWVRERIIPVGRHNISEILKNHKMESYDEMKFLEISRGKCSQDSMYIKKIDEMPGFVLGRRKIIVDCTPCDNNSILCFFENDELKKVDLNECIEIDGVHKIISNEKLFRSCKVGTGGYSVTFNDSIDIPASVLYETGISLPLSLNDFMSFARNNLIDTSECCNVLECSRQNVSYLSKHDQLSPIKSGVKGNLYLKGNVTRNLW